MIDTPRPGTARLQHLLVDYGEVVTTAQPPDDLARLAAIAGLDVPELVERYWRNRAAYDLGCTAGEYWSDALERSVTGELLDALTEADTASWCHLNDEVLTILRSAAEDGVRLTLLSNAPHELARRVRTMPVITELFDDLLFSAELGAAKPDPTVFRTALTLTGTVPAETLFVDDRERNLIPARELGLQTLQFTTAEALARTAADLRGR